MLERMRLVGKKGLVSRSSGGSFSIWLLLGAFGLGMAVVKPGFLPIGNGYVLLGFSVLVVFGIKRSD